MRRLLLPVLALSVLMLPDMPSAAPGAHSFDEATRQLMTKRLAHADEDGLEPGRYVAGPDLAARFKTYMTDLSIGRAELKRLDADVALPVQVFDADKALAGALNRNDFTSLLKALPPPGAEYGQLKAGLARYRALAASGGWSALPPHPEPAALAKRLAVEDPASGEPADIATGVKRFQFRMGLEPDGVVGKATLAALNLPVQSRIATIIANMERWRWLPRNLEADRIVINVADASLQLWLGGRVVLTSRVIVGRPRDPTPILRADGVGITFNPPWTVPTSIAAKEILPKLKANHAYLQSQDMVLLNGPPGDPAGLTVNWRAIPSGTFPYRIRQHPGPRNPLGQVKLELPNRFDVYLHDTPGKSAFAANNRALSHGCVRVEKILPLASYALAADLSQSEAIAAAIAAGETSYRPLSKTLPIYFLYWTAFPEADGTLAFRNDLYGRDKRLIAALRAQTIQVAGIQTACAKA